MRLYAEQVTDALVPTASWGRRILALVVDWTACTLVVIAVLGRQGYSDDPLSGFYVLVLYVAESAFLTALAGGSFGKLATRLRTVRNDPTYRPISLLLALLRQFMIALVIPPLVFKPDGRGAHDLAADSRTVRLLDLKG